jgi:hypothetical protein
MGTRRWRLRLGLLLMALGAACAQADSGRWFDEVAYFHGRGADLNLKEVPGSLLGGDIPWEDSWFNGVSLTGSWRTLGQQFPSLAPTFAAGFGLGYEVLALQHHGRQDNQEIGAALTLKSPAADLGVLSVGAMAGLGLSHALGMPSYEDGARDDPSRRYRLQQLMLFGLEWRAPGSGRWSLETRVHHRSGIYGLIAPPHVGSNFFAIGVRYPY